MHYEVAFQCAVTALRRELQSQFQAARGSETAVGRQSEVRKGLMVGDSDDDAPEEQKQTQSKKLPHRRDRQW